MDFQPNSTFESESLNNNSLKMSSIILSVNFSYRNKNKDALDSDLSNNSSTDSSGIKLQKSTSQNPISQQNLILGQVNRFSIKILPSKDENPKSSQLKKVKTLLKNQVRVYFNRADAFSRI